MFRDSELAQIKVSVREQQLKQQWRTRLLWTLRIISIGLLFVILFRALATPFADIDAALDRCLQTPKGQARICMRQEVETRRLAVVELRAELLGLVILAALTLFVSAMVRFGLRR